jgi:hypothetical protein
MRKLGVALQRRVPMLGEYIVDLLAPEVRLSVRHSDAKQPPSHVGETDLQRSNIRTQDGRTARRAAARCVRLKWGVDVTP